MKKGALWRPFLLFRSFLVVMGLALFPAAAFAFAAFACFHGGSPVCGWVVLQVESYTRKTKARQGFPIGPLV